MKWWNGGSSEEKQTFRIFQSKNINIEEYLMKAESWRCNDPVCLYAYVPAEGSRTMCFYIYYYFLFYMERDRDRHSRLGKYIILYNYENICSKQSFTIIINTSRIVNESVLCESTEFIAESILKLSCICFQTPKCLIPSILPDLFAFRHIFPNQCLKMDTMRNKK